MHPILFKIGDFPIGTYGVAIVIGLFAALWVASWLGRRRGIHPDFFYDLAFVLLLTGFLGARILYIITDWKNFTQDPLGIIFSRQGFVFWGGFLGALPAGIWFVRRRKLPLLEVMDIIAPCLALAHAFGRIGCFFAGCCYGLVCAPGHDHGWLEKVAVQYPLLTDATGQPIQMFNIPYWEQLMANPPLIQPGQPPLPVVAVQLVESGGNFLIFGMLLWFWLRKRHFSGQIFSLYLLVYSVMRFNLEFMRGDVGRGIWLGGISTSQIISLLTFAAAIGLWLTLRGRGITPMPAQAGITPETAVENSHPAAGSGKPQSRSKKSR